MPPPAGAAAVTGLAAGEVVVDRRAVELQAGGQPGDDRDERGAVRLAGGREAERHARDTTAPRMTSIGAGTPVQRVKLSAPWRTSTSTPSTTTSQPAARAASTSAVGAASGR